MFGLFRKKAPPSAVRVESDLVYVDDAARADAVASAVRAHLEAGRRVALLTPFRGHIPSIREQLTARGVRTYALDLSYRDAAPPPDAAYLLDGSSVPLLLSRSAAAPPMAFVQVERHPLRAHDLAVEAALEAHAREHRLRVYLSLDDGLMTLFDASGRVKKLTVALEIPMGEPIEHAMVTSSIENAQAKLAKKVRAEVPADTFAAWREKNLAKR